MKSYEIERKEKEKKNRKPISNSSKVPIKMYKSEYEHNGNVVMCHL